MQPEHLQAENPEPQRSDYDVCRCPDDVEDACGGCQEYAAMRAEWQAVEDYRDRRDREEEGAVDRLLDQDRDAEIDGLVR